MSAMALNRSGAIQSRYWVVRSRGAQLDVTPLSISALAPSALFVPEVVGFSKPADGSPTHVALIVCGTLGDDAVSQEIRRSTPASDRIRPEAQPLAIILLHRSRARVSLGLNQSELNIEWMPAPEPPGLGNSSAQHLPTWYIRSERSNFNWNSLWFELRRLENRGLISLSDYLSSVQGNDIRAACLEYLALRELFAEGLERGREETLLEAEEFSNSVASHCDTLRLRQNFPGRTGIICIEAHIPDLKIEGLSDDWFRGDGHGTLNNNGLETSRFQFMIDPQSRAIPFHGGAGHSGPDCGKCARPQLDLPPVRLESTVTTQP
jgi:hypothetical protein